MTTTPPPYPRIGEIYRALAAAFDTKARHRIVDRLSREGEFDWCLVPGLAEDVLLGALRRQVDADFASLLARHLAQAHADYIALVQACALDGLSRDEALPLLAEHWFGLAAACWLDDASDAFGGPPLMRLLDAGSSPFAVTLDWLAPHCGDDPARIAFPGTTRDAQDAREKVARWRNGIQLPDLAGIKLFADGLDAHAGERAGVIASAARRWLVVARALACSDQRTGGDIRATLRRHLLAGLRPVDIVGVLGQAVRHAGKRLSALSQPVLSLHERLKRTHPKAPGEMAATRTALDDLAVLFPQHDPQGLTRFHLAWLEGRWHVLAGRLDAAMPHYRAALDGSSYRAGEAQRRIVQEALVLAASLRRKPWLKEMKHRAVAFGLFADPCADDVIEEWEIDHLRVQFDLVFPAAGRFVETPATADDAAEAPPPAIDLREAARRPVDLAHPDRVVRIRLPDGQLRRWHQLRLFAGVGNREAVARLLKHGASVDSRDPDGASALLVALQLMAADPGAHEIVDLLLDRPHAPATLDGATARKRWTPLHCALELGAVDLVRRLLASGARADRRGLADHQTPLHRCMELLALLRSPEGAVRSLLAPPATDAHRRARQEALRRFGVRQAGVFGEEAPLQRLARDPENRALLDGLLAQQARAEIRHLDEDRIHAMVALLLEHHADPNAPHHGAEPGRTPLMLAAETDAVDLFELLLRFGGDPRRCDDAGADCRAIANAFGAHRVLARLDGA